MGELEHAPPHGELAGVPVRPRYVGLMEGKKSPLAKAFLWCNWDMELTVDLEGTAFDPPLDMSCKEVQKDIVAAAMRAHVVTWGMTCASYPKQRSIPDSRMPHSLPMRSDEHPLGPSELLAEPPHPQVGRGTLAN